MYPLNSLEHRVDRAALLGHLRGLSLEVVDEIIVDDTVELGEEGDDEGDELLGIVIHLLELLTIGLEWYLLRRPEAALLELIVLVETGINHGQIGETLSVLGDVRLGLIRRTSELVPMSVSRFHITNLRINGRRVLPLLGTTMSHFSGLVIVVAG